MGQVLTSLLVFFIASASWAAEFSPEFLKDRVIEGATGDYWLVEEGFTLVPNSVEVDWSYHQFNPIYPVFGADSLAKIQHVTFDATHGEQENDHRFTCDLKLYLKFDIDSCSLTTLIDNCSIEKVTKRMGDAFKPNEFSDREILTRSSCHLIAEETLVENEE